MPIKRYLTVASVALPIVLLSSHSYAFMERIGQDTVNSALDRLSGMQDKLVKDILSTGQMLINDMATKANAERKGTVAQVGSELGYAISQLTTQFGAQMNGTIGNASQELKDNLAVILAWTDQMQGVTNALSATEDDFAIDIEKLPFAKRTFSIRRVAGINILQGDRSKYSIVITGEDFGSPSQGENITISATIGDFELQRGSTLGTNQVEYLIPASFLAEKFNKKDIETLDLNISAVRQRQGCFISSCRDDAKGTFKLLLTPETLGRLDVQLERQQYAWTPTSTYTGQFAVKDPTPIVLNPLPADPEGHLLRYGTPSVECRNVQRQAWRLPNGNIILPGDPLLNHGWTSSSYVGDPRGPDLSRFDNEAKRDLGFTTGFWANNSCPVHGHCTIGAEVMRAQSVELSELGHCDINRVAAIDVSPDRERVTISIVGSAPHESLFVVQAPIEAYLPTGVKPDPGIAQSSAVTAAGPVDVHVPAHAYALLKFTAFDGIVKDGRLPLALPYQLEVLQDTTVGDTKVYTLTYKRPKGH